MPVYQAMAGHAGQLNFAGGGIQYCSVIGFSNLDITEANMQTKVYDSYIMANLYVYCSWNTNGAGNFTVTNRINGGDGTCQVIIGAGATGVFQDAINSDALVADNLIDNKLLNNGIGNVNFTMISYTMTTATDTVFILATQTGYGNPVTWGNTEFVGMSAYTRVTTPEATCAYRWRVTAVLSKLRVYVVSNSCNANTIVHSRVNGVDGNLTLTIGSGATGEFEDAANSDNVAIADEVCYEIDCSASGAGQLSFATYQMRSNSAGQQLLNFNYWPTVGVNDGDTQYICINSHVALTVTEARAQCDLQGAFDISNLFCYVVANTVNGNTVVVTRVGGVNGNLTVTVGSGATGIFEDTGNSDSLVAGNLYNFRVVAAGTVGTWRASQLGVEIQQAGGGGGGGAAHMTAFMAGKLVGAGIL